MTQQTPAAVPTPFRLSRMISSLWVPQAIHTAAALGLADAMAAGPRTSDDLAAAVGAHPGALHRLLRGLVALELCTTTADGRFELTELGSCLRSDTRDSVRAWALLMGDRVWLSRVRAGAAGGGRADDRARRHDPGGDPRSPVEPHGIFKRSWVRLPSAFLSSPDFRPEACRRGPVRQGRTPLRAPRRVAEGAWARIS